MAESILLPNRFVSPNFHPTTLTLNDGSTVTGFIEGEGKTLKLRMITGLMKEIALGDIKQRKTSKQSMMPAGLVKTPVEMQHILAYLIGKGKIKEK